MTESKASTERATKLKKMLAVRDNKDLLIDYLKATKALYAKYPFALSTYKNGEKWSSQEERDDYSKEKYHTVTPLAKKIQKLTGFSFKELSHYFSAFLDNQDKFISDLAELQIKVDKDRSALTKEVSPEEPYLTPEEDAEFDRLDAMGTMTADEIIRKIKHERFYVESFGELIDLVVDHFGTTKTPYDGSTFILPNGEFLDLHSYKAGHAVVDTWLESIGKLPYENTNSGGSKVLQDEGCIRCDTRKSYIQLVPAQPSSEQYNSLLVWLDKLSSVKSKIMLLPERDASKSKTYDFSEYISDEIVEKIKGYYIFGSLTEGLTGVRHDRHPIGESIDKPTKPNKPNPRLMEVTRHDLVGKVRSQDKQRYGKRLAYRPATFDGINIRELFTNDDLVFTTKVGDYTDVVAVRGVLTELKSLIHDKGKCTYADVLKAVNRSLDKDGIRMDCECADWKYRYRHWAYKGGYLYGEPGKSVEPPNKTNPGQRGSMCKHLASVLSRKEWIVKVAQSINNYIRLNRDICDPYLYDKNVEPEEDTPKKVDDKSPEDTSTPQDDTSTQDTQSDEGDAPSSFKSKDDSSDEPEDNYVGSKDDGEDGSNS